jgi:septal ring factor EnvC (AmiA/AmiB activator)
MKLSEIEIGKNKTTGDYERLGWEHEKMLKQNEELLLKKEKNEKTIKQLEKQLNKLVDDNAKSQRDGKDMSQSYESLKRKEEEEAVLQ